MPSLSTGNSADIRHAIATAGKEAGLTELQTSYFTALVQWRGLHTGSGEEQHLRREYLQELGYLKSGKIERVSSGDAEEAFSLLTQQICSPQFSPESMRDTWQHITRICTFLPDQAAQQLHQIMTHYERIDRLNLVHLDSIYPVPVAGPSLVGFFLHLYEGGPQAALRHIRSASNAFHVIRDLAEWTLSDAAGAAVVSIGADGAFGAVVTEKDLFEVSHLAIERAPDILGIPARKTVPHVIIPFPELPQVPINEPSRSAFKSELAEQLADWLLFGRTEGDALNRDRKQHYPKGPKNNFGHFTPAAPSALEELKAFADLSDKLLPFRQQVNEALEKGAPIVFSLRQVTWWPINEIKQKDSEKEVSVEFLPFLVKHAFNPLIKITDSLKIIREAKWITNAKNESLFSGAEQRREDEDDHQRLTTHFTFRQIDVSSSVRAILSRQRVTEVGLKREDQRSVLLKVMNLRGFLGNTGAKRFAASCAERFGENFSLAQEVERALVLTPSFTSTQLRDVLTILAEAGERSLTPLSERLIQDKFFLRSSSPAKILATFSSHKPKTIGPIPLLFERLDTFDQYSNLGSKTIGVKAESHKIAALLRENTIVNLVDQQNYNNELIPEIFGQKIAQDLEPTGTIWGHYVRGGGRVVMSLVRNVIEGEHSHLKDWTVVKPQSEPRYIQSIDKAIRKVFDLDARICVDMALVTDVMGQLTTHSEQSLLFIDAASSKSIETLKSFVEIVSSLGVKVVIRSRQSIPGIHSVTLSSWGDDEVALRIREDRDRLSKGLEVEPISDKVIQLACQNVSGFRDVHEDPLHLTLLVLELAAMRTRAAGSTTIHESDVSEAISSVFRLPDSAYTQRILRELESMELRLPDEVIGQNEAMFELLRLVRGHLSGARDPNRPLSVLLPGPTGVGKTELLVKLAHHLSIPYFPIDGTRYGEEHSYAALLGSPTGYVGPDEGPLFKFAEDNALGIVFADELDKMHSGVRRALMNLCDKGNLTAGNGRQIHRPGLIVVGATNASANKIYRGMPIDELHKSLQDALVDKDTKQKQPEVIKRWTIIPMPAIREADFRKIIRNSLESIRYRPGFLTANLELVSVDESAVDAIFTHCSKVCTFTPENDSKQNGGTKGKQFYDMRFVKNGIDALALEDLNRVIALAHENGTASSRTSMTRLSLGSKKNSDPPQLIFRNVGREEASA